GIVIGERKLSELLRSKQSRLPAAHGSIEKIVAQLFHFFHAGAGGRELPNLIENYLPNFVAIPIRFRNYYDEKTGRPTPLIDTTLDLNYGLFALDQLLIKPRALALKQQMAGER